MTRENTKILNFIKTNDNYMKKIKTARLKHNNNKDFTNQILYIVMDLVNTEKQFYGVNRKNIDVVQLSKEFFLCNI